MRCQRMILFRLQTEVSSKNHIMDSRVVLKNQLLKCWWGTISFCSTIQIHFLKNFQIFKQDFKVVTKFKNLKNFWYLNCLNNLSTSKLVVLQNNIKLLKIMKLLCFIHNTHPKTPPPAPTPTTTPIYCTQHKSIHLSCWDMNLSHMGTLVRHSELAQQSLGLGAEWRKHEVKAF